MSERERERNSAENVLFKLLTLISLIIVLACAGGFTHVVFESSIARRGLVHIRIVICG